MDNYDFNKKDDDPTRIIQRLQDNFYQQSSCAINSPIFEWPKSRISHQQQEQKQQPQDQNNGRDGSISASTNESTTTPTTNNNKKK